MFQFTTTNVINSDLDLSTGKSLWSLSEDEKTFHVKRVNNFKAKNVVAIYKAEANDPEMAKVCFSVSGLKAEEGDTLRLSIYVGLTQASQDSRYSNDMVLKGKPFTVEFEYSKTGGTAKMAEKLEKVINNYQLFVYGDKLLKVSRTMDMITIEATNEYQRFKTVNIEKFIPEAFHGMGEYKVIKSLDDLTEVKTAAEVTGQTENYFVGKEGFGTYSWILHNLRLPTSTRTGFMALNTEETPIPGALYDQYTIHYCAKRGILGLNAVGDVTKSLTTHVFFVKRDLAEDFELALSSFASNTVAGEITEVPEKKD